MRSMNCLAILLFGFVAASSVANAQTDRKIMNQTQPSTVSTEQRSLKSATTRDPGARMLPPNPCRDDRCSTLRKDHRSGAGDSRALNPQPIPPGKTHALNPQPIPPGKPHALNPQPIPPGKVGAAPRGSNQHAQKKKKKKIYAE